MSPTKRFFEVIGNGLNLSSAPMGQDNRSTRS
ncbi:protein of unknown function (plasmid) [Cupriavidus taiwanensis]|uniref:Uncharacterized protein n=2 Tax=Cupriavidus TaxID=106589 RepID=A0A375HUI5_9BURK|nr:protein of unknown function [Cupriavidus taiwanensis]SPD61888.1 protein of unknown function [Cupriavidus taiwanensis]SPD62550.1 protein of unknown function [Cupriavidus neocaledonicus]SPD69669.1 protein of unknown function [Cupriavidus taiwanensis]